MKKSAFTTSELLIVIGIISIIAALFFRTMINGFPNPEEKKLQKAQYQLEQLVNQMYSDESMYPQNSTYIKQGFKNTDDVIIKGVHYGGNDKFCKLFASRFNKKSENVTCSTEGEHNTVSFTSNDNIDWYLPSTDFSKGYTTVFADINSDNIGFSNNTNACTYNASTCPNPDLFKFYVKANGTVVASKDNTIQPDAPTDDTDKPYSISVDVACSDNTDSCGSVSTTVNSSQITVTPPGDKITNLATGTYTFTATPAASYYPNWTTRNIIVDGNKIDTNIKIVFAPIGSHCLYVNVNDCDQASPASCATFTIGGQTMSQRTVNSKSYSTMQYCGLTQGDYTLSVTPKTGYYLDPIPKDNSGNPLDTLTQTIKIGTEDVRLDVNLKK